MSRAVVTGASGFIGKALTKRLLDDGWTVYAVVRDAQTLAGLKGDLRPVECDFAHYGCLAEKIHEKVDWFLHFGWAGVSGPASRSITAQGENIRASAEAMEQAKRLEAKRFLFAGSSYQYRMEPAGEAFLAKNLYGAAKAAAGRLLWSAAFGGMMQYNSVLFTNVYGVGDRSERSTNTMLRKLLAGEPLRLISGEHLHDWTYIDDAVGGVMAVLESGRAGKEYYIGARELSTFRDIITRARDAVSPETELRFGEYEDRAYIDYGQIDLDALYRDTGFECTSDFEESIKKTAVWLAQEDNKAMEKYMETANIRRGGVTSSTYIVVAVRPSLSVFCKGGAA